MFGFLDLLSLMISAFIILPAVTLLRECGYIITGAVFGAENSRITFGSGRSVFKRRKIDIRRYYHIYSWFSFDNLKRDGAAAYVTIYLSPIIINVAVGLTLNYFLSIDAFGQWETFWDRFVFYMFFYVLFDVMPMRTVNGKPNNGMVIYQMLRYGHRVDYNMEYLIPSTKDVDELYEKEMERQRESKLWK